MASRGGKGWKKTMNTELNEVEIPHNKSRSSEHVDMKEDETGEASLASIFKELKDFRQDCMKQLSDIQQKLHLTNNRLEEAECRIDDVETAMQAASTLLRRLVRRQDEMEAKLTDQEARARRDNIRIYSIPEQAEGNNIISFLEELLQASLDFPRDAEIKIERAHRAPGPKPKPHQSLAPSSPSFPASELKRRLSEEPGKSSKFSTTTNISTWLMITHRLF